MRASAKECAPTPCPCLLASCHHLEKAFCTSHLCPHSFIRPPIYSAKVAVQTLCWALGNAQASRPGFLPVCPLLSAFFLLLLVCSILSLPRLRHPAADSESVPNSRWALRFRQPWGHAGPSPEQASRMLGPAQMWPRFAKSSCRSQSEALI